MKCIKMLALTLAFVGVLGFADHVEAQTNPGPAFVVYGYPVSGNAVICRGMACSSVISQLGYNMTNSPMPGGGGTGSAGPNFCANLQARKPNGCGAVPPSVPQIDPGWVGNGCGDGSFGSDIVSGVLGIPLPFLNLNSPGVGITFTTVCNQHDRCYGTNFFSRSVCDDKFRDSLFLYCATNSNPACGTYAMAYANAVGTFGEDAYDEAGDKFACARWFKDKEANGCP